MRPSMLTMRDQLSVVVSLGVILLALATSLAGAWYATTLMRGVFIAEGERTVTQLASQSVLAVVYDSQDNAMPGLDAAMRVEGVVRAEVRRPDGRLVAWRGDFWGGDGVRGDDFWVFEAPIELPPSDENPFWVGNGREPHSALGSVRLIQSKQPLKALVRALFLASFTIAAIFSGLFIFSVRYVTTRMVRPIGALAEVMRTAEDGKPGIRAVEEGPIDVRYLSATYNRLMVSLEERDRDHRRWAVRIDAVREEQNRLIAQEIHDSLGGYLSSIKLGLASVLEETSLHPEVREELELLHQSTEQAIRISKDVTTSLRPTMLDILGLNGTLKSYADRWSKQARVDVNLDLGDDRGLSQGTTVALFRIVQECLTNVMRHSGATKVMLSTQGGESNLVLIVADNGCGFNLADVRHGGSLGLVGMRERVEYLGGAFEVVTSPGHGVTVCVTVPLANRGGHD